MRKNFFQLGAAFSILAILLATPLKAEVIAITGATAYTMGDKGKIENATILVEDGRIKAIGQDIRVPANANIIDARGKVVTPGFMNSYTNLSLEEISLSAGPTDEAGTGSASGPAFDVRYGINPASILIPANRTKGLTHVMVAPTTSRGVFAGTGAVIHLGQGTNITIKPSAALFVELDENANTLSGGARSASWMSFRTALEDARHFDRNRKAYDEGRTRRYSLDRPDLEALVPAATGKMLVVITTSRASDILQALDIAKEFDLKLIIHGGEQAWMVANELAAAKVPVILQPDTNLPVHFEDMGSTLKNAARLQAAGVLIAFSNLDETLSHNAYLVSQQAGMAVAGGLPWEEALKAITINPARIWGIDRDYGSLEVGKKADIVVWSADPLELTTSVEAELIEGQIMPLTSRRTILRDRYRHMDQANPPFSYR